LCLSSFVIPVSLPVKSTEQIELARTLARANLAAGILYLSRMVPTESTERRHELAKHLAESS